MVSARVEVSTERRHCCTQSFVFDMSDCPTVFDMSDCLTVVLGDAGGARVIQVNGSTRDVYYYPKGTVSVKVVGPSIRPGEILHHYLAPLDLASSIFRCAGVLASCS